MVNLNKKDIFIYRQIIFNKEDISYKINITIKSRNIELHWLKLLFLLSKITNREISDNMDDDKHP